MKNTSNSIHCTNRVNFLFPALLLALLTIPAFAQDAEPEKDKEPKKELARPAFESALLGDMQSVVVQTPKTLEWDFQHRFGTLENGIKDFFGIYANGANIRMGLTYTPINRLAVGIGITKNKMALDVNYKYAIFQQTKDDKMPVSVSFFGNTVADTQKGDYNTSPQRLSFYNELIIARRINNKISIQISQESHDNAVIDSAYNNNMLAIGFGGRYKFSAQSSVLINYTQPLSAHKNTAFNPKPGLTIAWEVSTSAHAFQMFFTSYQGILPQENVMYNPLDFTKNGVLFGFNITRLWNF